MAGRAPHRAPGPPSVPRRSVGRSRRPEPSPAHRSRGCCCSEWQVASSCGVLDPSGSLRPGPQTRGDRLLGLTRAVGAERDVPGARAAQCRPCFAFVQGASGDELPERDRGHVEAAVALRSRSLAHPCCFSPQRDVQVPVTAAGAGADRPGWNSRGRGRGEPIGEPARQRRRFVGAVWPVGAGRRAGAGGDDVAAVCRCPPGVSRFVAAVRQRAAGLTRMEPLGRSDSERRSSSVATAFSRGAVENEARRAARGWSAGTGPSRVASAGGGCWECHNLTGGAADGIGSAPVLAHHERLRFGACAERAREWGTQQRTGS